MLGSLGGKMSYIDLATLALHRRNEMESRINLFVSKCDQATHDIWKLKMRAKSFVDHLNCDPSELKDRFLHCMKTLDEYLYLITDFNLSISKLDEMTGVVMEYTPVLDKSSKSILVPNQSWTMSNNIMDILSEATPTTSNACPNKCPTTYSPRKIPKEEQTLIRFSSPSCSDESFPKSTTEKSYVNNLSDNVNKLHIRDTVTPPPSEFSNLPAQTLLETDHVYPAAIMNVDGHSIWVITEDIDNTCKLMNEMTQYYKEHHVEMTQDQINSLTYCAYYDDENECYCRGLYIKPTEGEQAQTQTQGGEQEASVAEVFLVDTGEVRALAAAAAARLQPLAARFYTAPPHARCCHLAGIDFQSHNNKELALKQEQFLKQYIGTHCSIEVEDNSSESLGVYLILSDTETLNELLVQNGLAWTIGKVAATLSSGTSRAADSEVDIVNCPEYEDPVEAVTGYSCRDEADVCKNYKGGPEKTCFKGARCKKKHITLHPDGWSLDRVSVVARCVAAPLPAPGSWRRALPTAVCHYDRLYVQLLAHHPPEPLPLPEFGVVLPPRTLEELIKDMNNPATRMSYKPLKIMPAPGELVAALYLDDRWYRARVIAYSRADQNVEVMYIDYGNQVWVRENNIRELETRLCVLPAQATRCVLAGVSAASHEPQVWVAAKKRLTELTHERMLDLHVIARDYDEITVEMFDEQGNSIADQLAASGLVKLQDYSVIDDSNVTKKYVVP